MQASSRPVILVGEGCRYADLAPLLACGIPILSSWQAADLIDNSHPNYFGRPGIYGQRCANKILYDADTVISIGCRLSPWMIGHQGLRPEQQLVMCDVDTAELHRFPKAEHYCEDASTFIAEDFKPIGDCIPWVARCEQWRNTYEWQEHAAATPAGFIDAYAFVEHLSGFFRPDEVIVTDMGTALCAAFQTMKLKPPQRLMTSGGLGEMGVALPAAIGASFARNKGSVICLHCDGGMMMNLQELQTIRHHNLPIKIIVFSNDGYVMLKHTQKTQNMAYSGVNDSTGVSCPDFAKVSYAFGITSFKAKTWGDIESLLPIFLHGEGSSLLEIETDPEQPLSPKLGYEIVDGKQQYRRFDELT